MKCPCCNGSGHVEPEHVAPVKDLFAEGGRQHWLADYIEVSGVLVSFEHTGACHDQCRVHARIPGCMESWGEDIKLPTQYEHCTVAQFDKAVLDFFNRFDDPLVKCSNAGCRNVTWNRQHFPSKHRDTRCSACWFADFNAKQTVAQAESEREQYEAMAKMKAKGYTHVVVAWVHPGSGDDYPVRAFYTGKPGPREIAKLLAGSIVKNDYKVKEL